MEILQKTKVSPNKLPFLQAQILIKLYSDIESKIITTINSLSNLTGYPKKSKILHGALYSLIDKGFISGNLEEGFYIPESCVPIFNKIVKKLDFKSKQYSDRIIKLCKNSIFPESLFDGSLSLSELNKIGTIHRWYNYLEEFPFSLIEEKLNEYNIRANSIVVDPFVGSGTTLITAKMFHHNTIGFDSNPLMVFVSNVKTNWNINLDEFKSSMTKISSLFLNKVHDLDKIQFKSKFLYNMPKKEINQWLSSTLQKEVALLKDIIEDNSNGSLKDLFLLALSKSCFDASYVALCPGTTFYPFREKEEFWYLFTDKIIEMYKDLEAVNNQNGYLKSRIINDTCLNASKYIRDESIDFIITSPPYPNDLEYTRQTRLELYLLDFVNNMEDVQQIKRTMVKGSTKLIFKESESEKCILNFKSIKMVSDKIYEKTKDKNWGFDYPRMVREYFGDMYLNMREFYMLLKKDSYYLLVVGDQTIKNVYIPVCDILIEMAESIGYRNCKKELFRIRRSSGHKVELPEEIVIIQK